MESFPPHFSRPSFSPSGPLHCPKTRMKNIATGKIFGIFFLWAGGLVFVIHWTCVLSSHYCPGDFYIYIHDRRKEGGGEVEKRSQKVSPPFTTRQNRYEKLIVDTTCGDVVKGEARTTTCGHVLKGRPLSEDISNQWAVRARFFLPLSWLLIYYFLLLFLNAP